MTGRTTRTASVAPARGPSRGSGRARGRTEPHAPVSVPCPTLAYFARSGTSISAEVEHRFRDVEHPFRGKWNAGSGPLRNGVGTSCGVDERGAAGALPGAAAGRRVPAPVPPAGGPEVAATAVERRGADAPGAAGPVPGVAGRVAGIPHRVRDRGVARSCLRSGVCRYWSLSICPGASGVTARPWVASATVVRATSRGARGVESQVPVANRLGGTDRSTSLRSDGRSTSPEFVFHFTELRTRAGTATGGCGRRRSYGRKERAHRSLENRKERGFPQRPQPIVLLHRIWKSTGPTSADRRVVMRTRRAAGTRG